MASKPAKIPVPFLGKWNLKSVQSTSTVNLPFPQRGSTIFTQEPDGIHYAAEAVYSDGQTRHIQATFRLDGQSYPVIGSVLGDTLTAKQIDPLSFEVTVSKAGRVSAKANSKLSDDGKLMTTEWEVNGPDGSTICYTTVGERQAASWANAPE